MDRRYPELSWTLELGCDLLTTELLPGIAVIKIFLNVPFFLLGSYRPGWKWSVCP